jgi:hypothetical protein
MVKTLLQHSWLSFWRSKTLGRSLGTTIFTWVMIFVIMLYAVGLGLMLERIITKLAPDQEVITVLNGWLIFYWLFELIMRIVFQRNISLNIQYYLTQNLAKRSLAHYMLIKSLKNLFLLITIILFSPFAFTVIAPSFDLATAWLWLLSLLAMSFVLHYLTIVIQQYSKGGLLVPFLIAISLFGCIYLDQNGWVDLSSYSVIIMGKLMATPIALVAPVALIAFLYYFNLGLVVQNLSLESIPQRTKIASAGIRKWVAYLGSFGLVGQLIALELRLIWRNKRPRALMLSSVFMIAYFVFFLARLDQSTFISAFVLVTTGAFMINYGQLMFSWESGYFDFILTRNISAKVYLTSKLVLLLAFNTVSLLIMAIVLVFIDPSLLKDLVIWYLINSGLFTYIFIWGTMLGPKPVDVNARAMFNYEGLSAFQFLVVIPYFVAPIGTAYLLSKYFGDGVRDVLLVALGLGGIILYQIILRALSKRFINRKYKISNGFRE